MKRRDFIAVLSGATAWPLAARAQERMRRVTVVLGFEQGDHEGQSRAAAFVETLARFGWSDGRNIRLDIRWAGANIANYKAVAKEIAATSPEVVVAMRQSVAEFGDGGQECLPLNPSSARYQILDAGRSLVTSLGASSSRGVAARAGGRATGAVMPIASAYRR